MHVLNQCSQQHRVARRLDSAQTGQPESVGQPTTPVGHQGKTMLLTLLLLGVMDAAPGTVFSAFYLQLGLTLTRPSTSPSTLSRCLMYMYCQRLRKHNRPSWRLREHNASRMCAAPTRGSSSSRGANLRCGRRA